MNHRALIDYDREVAEMEARHKALDDMIERDERRQRLERWRDEPTMSGAENIAMHAGRILLGAFIGYGIMVGASILGILVGLGFYFAGLYGYHMSPDTAMNLVVLAVGVLGYMFFRIFGRIGAFIGKILFGIFLLGWIMQFFH